MRLITLLFATIIAGQIVSAQSFYIRPYIGLQRIFSNVQVPPSDKRTLQNNSYNDYPDAGLMVEYHKKRWSVASGLTLGAAGYSFQLEIPEPVGLAGYATHTSSGYGMYRIPLQFSYRLSDIKLLSRRKNIQSKCLINGGIELLGGLAFNDYFDEKRSRFNIIPFFRTPNDSIVGTGEVLRVRNHGIALYGGVRFNFSLNGGQGVAVSLWYNQGLSTILRTNVEYIVNGRNYAVQFGGNGSTFNVNLSVPIKIYESASSKQYRKDLLLLQSSNIDHESMPVVENPFKKASHRIFSTAYYFSSTSTRSQHGEVGYGHFIADGWEINGSLYYVFNREKIIRREEENFYITAGGQRYFGKRNFGPFVGVSYFQSLIDAGERYVFFPVGASIRMGRQWRTNLSVKPGWDTRYRNIALIPYSLGVSFHW